MMRLPLSLEAECSDGGSEGHVALHGQFRRARPATRSHSIFDNAITCRRVSYRSRSEPLISVVGGRAAIAADSDNLANVLCQGAWARVDVSRGRSVTPYSS